MFAPDTLKFFYANTGAMQQVGFNHDELVNMTTYDIKPEHDETSYREMIAPLLHGEKDSLYFETLHQHKDGHTVPVEIFLQYVHPEGETPRFVAIVRDISERKRIDQIKNEFISTVSHELRTPLTSIRGALGLMLGGAVGSFGKKTREMLEIANRNTQRLLMLINDLLDIQKIESGQMALRLERLNLVPFLEKIKQENATYGDQYNVSLEYHTDLEQAWVSADPGRLAQVMANLLSNAAKFSPQEDTVRIQLQRDDGMLRISVTDHGPGIPKSFHSKLFDKFTQLDSSDSRLKAGTGLGLHITRNIVERHGGHIGISTNEGNGTTFYVKLPEIQ
jgi:PAS domain S-box-containing protein